MVMPLTSSAKAGTLSHCKKCAILVKNKFQGILKKNMWPSSSPDLNPMDFSM
uniref:Uncharacterized protein n=1 Tax=Lepeophtheirus salmonis TaxID=72036 RepID=A0A0K2TPG8_LEPSM